MTSPRLDAPFALVVVRHFVREASAEGAKARMTMIARAKGKEPCMVIEELADSIVWKRVYKLLTNYVSYKICILRTCIYKQLQRHTNSASYGPASYKPLTNSASYKLLLTNSEMLDLQQLS